MEFLNYMQPSYDEKEINAVAQYMQSGAWLTEFTKTREFENSISLYTKSENCSVMTNGTDTLIAALKACGVRPGDEVIVPDFTMSATSHAVEMLGAKAVFVDVEKETFCMDYNCMVKAVTKKTKAVIFVDLNGRYSKRFEDIINYCKSNSLWLIEDAAQALGSKYKGKFLGSCGDIGSFSFSMPKIITTGQGGAIITDNDELFSKILQIRDFGREKAGSDHYMTIGANFKFTDIQAVIGIEQMKKLADRVERKKAISKKYDELLAGIPMVETVKNNYEDTAPCFIEIMVSEKKQELMEYLKAKNIGCRSFYPPLHSEPAYNRMELSFPNSEEISKRGLWLPSFANLTNQQIEYICGCVREFYNK